MDDLECYVLAGDSFGAVVSLALAIRQPPGLRALILSGGFAANPVRNPLMRARIRAACLMPGPLYRAITLRLHAASLASPFDRSGEIDWPKEKIREFFLKNTPFRSYAARAKAALSVDYLDRLRKVQVPTLLITPSYDKLIGKKAAAEMLEGIRDSSEIVLDKTVHMLRFTHPKKYSMAIRSFLEDKFGKDLSRTCGNLAAENECRRA